MPVHWTKSETRSCHLWKQHAADFPPAAIMAERECYITTGRGGESQEKTTSGLTHSLGWHKPIFTQAWQKSVKCECTKMNGKNRNWNVCFFFLSKANPGWKRKDKAFLQAYCEYRRWYECKYCSRAFLSLSRRDTPDCTESVPWPAARRRVPDQYPERAWSITNLIIINVGLSASVRSADSRATPWELQNGAPSEFGRAFFISLLFWCVFAWVCFALYCHQKCCFVFLFEGQ